MPTETQPQYPINPDDPQEFAKAKDDGRRFRVLGDAVGPHVKGHVLPALAFGRGADLNRLVRLDAIAEVPADTPLHPSQFTAEGTPLPGAVPPTVKAFNADGTEVAPAASKVPPPSLTTGADKTQPGPPAATAEAPKKP